MKAFELRNRRVLITGASRGLGRELAIAFARAGCDLALVARDQAALTDLVSVHGGICYPADLTDRQTVRTLIDRVESDGPIDVLVNNAAVEAVGAFTDLDDQALESMIYLNATATAELCRQAIPRMLSRGEGRIVNISSLAGIVTTPHLAAYSATKAFATQLSAGLSLELRGTPVTCTKVEIGEIRGTGQSENVRKDPLVSAIFERLYRLRLSRQLTPEEVTSAVLRAVRYGLPSVQLPRRVAPAARLADVLRLSTSFVTRGTTASHPTA